MGHDQLGKLRLVGGNYFSFPKTRFGKVPGFVDFFTQYDSADERGQQNLVRNAIENSIDSGDDDLLRCVRRECEHFHTMPICIVALTKRGPLFHATKAIIEGIKPVDFSYEYFGEVK
jgi:hypothetical protein